MTKRIWITGIVLCVLVQLSGCAHIIADQIRSANTLDVPNNISEQVTELKMCDEQYHCIMGQKLKDLDDTPKSIMFDFKVNDNHKVWFFTNKERQSEKQNVGIGEVPNNVLSIKSEHSASQLIFIFAGYGQPSQILFAHQQWLQLITGAEVIVIQSADKKEPFQFGLDFVSPIVNYIKQKKPEKVQLIGFSMGAVAAQAVSEQVENSVLHLIAPMTNFEHSTLALWEIIRKDKFYSVFISNDDVEEAIPLVYQKSKVNAQNLDVVNKVKNSSVSTYVYASTADKVTLAKDWNTLNSVTELNEYAGLNHIEIIGLIHKPLLRDFVSNIQGQRFLESDTKTLGMLCDYADKKCMSKLESLSKVGM